MNQLITLTVGGVELSFAPTEVEYNDYMNDLMPDNKVAPAHNFLFNTVTEETKEALRKITDKNKGAAVQITSAVMAEYAPQLEIKVKKIDGLVAALDRNDFEKMLAWRRKWLPGEQDTEANLARAVWLERQYWENMQAATANGVAKAFS